MEILTEIGDLQIGTIEKVILILLVAAIFNLEKILIVLFKDKIKLQVQ